MKTPTPRRPQKAASYRLYMAGVTSAADRRNILSAYRAILALERDLPDADGRRAMNTLRRECLYDAVLPVLDALESKNGGQPDAPRVVAMREVQHRLDADLGWSDPHEWPNAGGDIPERWPPADG